MDKRKRHPLHRSVFFAFQGIVRAVQEERNIKIEIFFGLLACLLGFYFNISKPQWLALILVIFTIISAEIFNTSIEKCCDLMNKKLKLKYHDTYWIRNFAAGAVMLLSIGSLILGAVIFFSSFKQASIYTSSSSPNISLTIAPSNPQPEQAVTLKACADVPLVCVGIDPHQGVNNLSSVDVGQENGRFCWTWTGEAGTSGNYQLVFEGNTSDSGSGTCPDRAVGEWHSKEISYTIGAIDPTPTPATTDTPDPTSQPTNSPSQQECCAGLTEIPNISPDANNLCPQTSPDTFVCAYCPNGECGIGENICNCPEDCSSAISNINLKTRFAGVPANAEETNLVDVNKTKTAQVSLAKERNGQIVFSEYLTFDYLENGVWGTSFTTELPLPADNNYDSNDYVVKIKGSAHRKIVYCQQDQEVNYQCRRMEGIYLEPGQDYELDFSSADAQPLDFGDVYTEDLSGNWVQDGQVNSFDFSFVKGCRDVNANIIGSGTPEEADFYNDGCKWADGDFDGDVDSADIDLLYKTLSTRPDDEV